MKSATAALLTALILFSTNTFSQSVGIGATSFTPNASSILEIQSTNKGMLIPRMTEAQRLAIASPAAGLLVYQASSDSGFYFYNGTAWRTFMSDTSHLRYRKQTFDISGRGAAVLSPVTVAFDNVFAEQFTINDELYFDEPIPLDYAGGAMIIFVDMVSMGAETNKYTRWSCVYKTHAANAVINGTTGTVGSGDLLLSSTQYIDQEILFSIPEVDIAGKEALHFKIKRVAIGAGSNPGTNPSIVNVSIKYLSNL